MLFNYSHYCVGNPHDELGRRYVVNRLSARHENEEFLGLELVSAPIYS